MQHAEFLAGMLAMALVGGLAVLLILRPWVRPMKRGWETSHEVVTENFRLQTARVKRQTAEEQNRAAQTAIMAEQTRAQLIQAKAKNDQAEIEATIEAEQTRLRLIEAKAESDRAEIERRAALKRAGINPDALSPRQVKCRLLIVSMATIGLFIIAIVIRIYFSK
ncbi:MAG: hypothetical protein HYV53_00925 [Parcubacteria group bacterium]|nr:hypothetical protein [Parcubacteria group bacterium]